MDSYKRSFFTICLTGVLMAFYGVLLLKPFVPSIRMAFMKEMHLNDASFFHWSTLHLLPAMYSFSNEVIYSPDFDGDDDLLDMNLSHPGMWRLQFNHYPLRIVTFGKNRHYHIRKNKPQQLVLFSEYRGESLATRYKLEPDGDRLIIKRK